MSVKILKRYQSSFERQIGESIMINHNLKLGVELLNSKNEYNRCSIPRLSITPSRDEFMEEILEKQKEKEFKKEIKRLKEELTSTGLEPKKKKIRLIDVYDKKQRDKVTEKKKEEERRESERREEVRIEKTRRKRVYALLDKIRKRSVRKKEFILNREWFERKKERC